MMLHISITDPQALSICTFRFLRKQNIDSLHDFLEEKQTERTCTLVFLSLSVELSLEWLCIVELNEGDGIGEVQELVEVGVPPVSLLLLLSVVADDGMPTPDNSTSSRPIISS